MRDIQLLPPKIAFLLVSMFLGELVEGLNIFQGIYLVGLGWHEGHVGIALSLMGLTCLLIQPFAGDRVDKASVDRRIYLAVAAILMALSSAAIMVVHDGDTDHFLVFGINILAGVSASFISPCIAALTLATFGPNHFDAVMASNLFWGHTGSVIYTILAGTVAFASYPQIKNCFLVIGASALLASALVPFMPQGDVLMGRGFKGKVAQDEYGHLERLSSKLSRESCESTVLPPTASGYWVVISDKKVIILSLTGFFFNFANANVLLVLGELMGEDIDRVPRRNSIPLVAGAIVIAQATMAIATLVGDRLTNRGIGRKPMVMAGLLALPIRCALIIWLEDAPDGFLLATQVFEGIGTGLMALMHPLLVADVTFGTGRFSLIMGLTESLLGLGMTLSEYLGQVVVEKYGHIASLSCSFVISLIPLVLYSFMPETLGQRLPPKDEPKDDVTAYIPMDEL